MHSDQKIQEKNVRSSATLTSNKLLLELDDNISYKGLIESTPYFDLKELKIIFESGKFEILCKTTSKMTIKLGYVKVELQSQENRLLQQFKNKIQQLQTKLQATERQSRIKIQALETKLRTQGQWEEENLDSKANFDMACIYKIDTNSGHNFVSTSVSTGTIYLILNGSSYSVTATNRRAVSSGWVLNKMWKKKI